MRSVMPAVFIRFPARMKNGTARSGKLSTPFTMRCATTISGTCPETITKAAEEEASATPTGTPIRICAKRATRRRTISMRAYSTRGEGSTPASGSMSRLVPRRRCRRVASAWWSVISARQAVTNQ